jgi:hypothetical protein
MKEHDAGALSVVSRAISIFIRILNVRIPDYPASGQSGTGLKTITDAGTSLVPE